jgi:hypothetical protein
MKIAPLQLIFLIYVNQQNSKELCTWTNYTTVTNRKFSYCCKTKGQAKNKCNLIEHVYIYDCVGHKIIYNYLGNLCLSLP